MKLVMLNAERPYWTYDKGIHIRKEMNNSKVDQPLQQKIRGAPGKMRNNREKRYMRATSIFVHSRAFLLMLYIEKIF